MRKFIERFTGAFEDKKRWRDYKRRARALPPEHRAGVQAVERYLMGSGEIPNDGARMLVMFEDLADLFEQSAADGVPVRAVVGDDPVEFAETFAQTYSDGGWIERQRELLRRRIDRAAADDASTGAAPEEEP